MTLTSMEAADAANTRSLDERKKNKNNETKLQFTMTLTSNKAQNFQGINNEF